MSDELTQCEAVISRGLGTFVEVGEALGRIRDKRLYREQFKNFEAYCKERWGIGKNRANQLIEAAGIAAKLTTVVVSSERAIRPLTRVPEQKREQVWAAAVESSPTGKPTHREVTEAANNIVHMPRTRDGGGDSEETCWRRGLIFRAEESIANAAFEDWSHFKVNSRLVSVARRAAEAWQELADYLKKLQHETKEKSHAA